MKSGLFLDVIVTQSPSIFELFASEDQTLLVRWDTFFVLNLGFDILNGVRRFDLESNGLTGQGFDEDLHFGRREVAKGTANRASDDHRQTRGEEVEVLADSTVLAPSLGAKDAPSYSPNHMEFLARVPLSHPPFELDGNLTWVDCLLTPASAVIGSQGSTGLILTRFGVAEHHTSFVSRQTLRCAASSNSLEDPLIAVLTLDHEVILYKPYLWSWCEFLRLSETEVKLLTICWYKQFLVGGGRDGKLYFYSFGSPKKSRGRTKKTAEDQVSLTLHHSHDPQLESGISLLRVHNDNILVGSKSGKLLVHDGKSPKDLQIWSEEDGLPLEQALLIKKAKNGSKIVVFCKGTFIVIVKGSQTKWYPSKCKMKVIGLAEIYSSVENKASFIMASLEERLVHCELDMNTLDLSQSEIANEAVKERSNYKGLGSSPFGLLFSFCQAAACLMEKSMKKPNTIFLYSTRSFEAICTWLAQQEIDCQASMSEVIEYVCTLKFLLRNRSISPENQTKVHLNELKSRSVNSLKVTRHKILLCKDFYENSNELLTQVENLIKKEPGKSAPCPVCKSTIEASHGECCNGHTFQRCPKSGDLCDPGACQVKQCSICGIQFIQSDSYFICCLCF